MRYLPLTADDRSEMLKTIGAKSVDDFYGDVPVSARLKAPIGGLPNHQGELAVERHMTKLAAKNRSASEGRFFVGCGAYKHHIPASVDHIIQRSEFLMRKGAIDMIVDRRQMRDALARLLALMLKLPAPA